MGRESRRRNGREKTAHQRRQGERAAMRRKTSTYALGGEELAVAAVAPLGLPLADRFAVGATGVPDGAVAMRNADGDWAAAAGAVVVGAGGARSAGVANEGRSWGAGEGAIAMAVLMAEMRKPRLRWGLFSVPGSVVPAPWCRGGMCESEGGFGEAGEAAGG